MRKAYLKRTHKGFVNGHHSACVIELAAIIWGAEKRHQLPLGKEFVTIFNYLYNYEQTPPRPSFKIGVPLAADLNGKKHVDCTSKAITFLQKADKQQTPLPRSDVIARDELRR